MLSNQWKVRDFYPVDYLPRDVRLTLTGASRPISRRGCCMASPTPRRRAVSGPRRRALMTSKAFTSARVDSMECYVLA
jgi:hypothetical protein